MHAPADPQHVVTRFAPSPTGRLHIGHGWSALLAHDAARAAGGRFLLRIEDIDGARSRPSHVAGIVEDLRWLGTSWDGAMLVQSARANAYAAALADLIARDLAYPCFCTRADIAASASAPHGPEGPVYPGTCRRLDPARRDHRIAAGETHAWRLAMDRAVARVGPLAFTDDHLGTIAAAPDAAGDIVLARKDAIGSYHLCATLDDAATGVTLVTRGIDLLPATHIHRLLQALLGLPTPRYRHHPLLLGADGRRLAKRSGGLELATLRAAGRDPVALANDLRAGRFPVGISLAAPYMGTSCQEPSV
jgi:glutamyl-Q tRNA(Asp) synthetase